MKTELKQKIDSLVSAHPILLFMKGTKERPQCGFSRQVVEILNQLVPDFSTVDILADQEMREGIKVYSSWPTIPQLYVNGEFIGGCDIVVDLLKKSQLQTILKLEKATSVPNIEISPEAIKAFRNAWENEGQGELIRIAIAVNFDHSLSFDDQGPEDFLIDAGDFKILLDPYSAVRAQNLHIDFVSDQLEAGFSFKNPNRPPEVKDLSVNDLKAWHEKGLDNALLIDVRSNEERDLAQISFAKPLSEVAIENLPKDKALIFHCHHGRRSMQMAERFRAQGFKNLFNLTGGIDAWSKMIDKSVPIY